MGVSRVIVTWVDDFRSPPDKQTFPVGANRPHGYGSILLPKLVWSDAHAPEACGFDCPFDDADLLCLADDLRNFSLSFG